MERTNLLVIENMQAFAWHQFEVFSIRFGQRVTLLLHSITIEAMNVVRVFRRQRQLRRRHQSMTILRQPRAKPIMWTIRFSN